MTQPAGRRVRLVPGTRVRAGGRLLVGGSLLTVLRLSERARALLAGRHLTVIDDPTANLADRLLRTGLAAPDPTGLPPADPGDLTVVIPARDRPDQLDRALAALTGLRTVVVDDASHDPSAVAAVAARHGAEYLPLTVNVGPAGARNAGLTRVSTSFVAFVDSDVEVTATDLLALSRHFTDPALAAVAPRVVAATRSGRPRWFERYEEVFSSLDLGPAPYTVRPGAVVPWLPAACLLARVDRLGDGFDPQLRVGEDVDLVWQLIDNGDTVRYDPTVTARHDTRTTVRAWLGRKYAYGTSGALLATRYDHRLAPAVITPAYAALAAAVLLRRRWTLPVLAAGLAWGTWRIRPTLPELPGRTTLAAELAATGLGWAVRQQSALLLRHWWPLTLATLPARPVRRAVTTALAVDAVITLRRSTSWSPGTAGALLTARRLDDLAYGIGLWAGALHHRSLTALLPRRPGT